MAVEARLFNETPPREDPNLIRSLSKQLVADGHAEIVLTDTVRILEQLLAAQSPPLDSARPADTQVPADTVKT